MSGAGESAQSAAQRWHRRPRVRRLLRGLLSPSKFALVGILGIFVNQAALFTLTEAVGIYYVLSAILASQVSTLHNFVLTEAWVFRHREANHRLVFRYLVFNGINAATLLVRVPVLFLLTEVGGLHYLVSNLVAIGLTFGVRYVVADNWIWAGRDRREQVTVNGSYFYDIHGLVRIRSTINLPELAAFNVQRAVRPDLVVRRGWIGGWPRLRARSWREGGVLRYREHLGLLSAAFDVHFPGDGEAKPILLEANWLLTWSHHVLYTNMVEPLLRFMLVGRDRVLLHCAAVDTGDGAVVLSAQTDTGKTSTVLRLLMHHSWDFLSDDMAIVDRTGRVLGYPKPMTLSSHTMSAVNEGALPLADRLMLGFRSRIHSKRGRTIGHALGRLPIPIVAVNAAVQLLVPPPKYHVQSLIDCELSEGAHLSSVILMERGDPLVEKVAVEPTLERLLENTDDAYTFPPFSTFAPEITVAGLDHDALRARERAVLADAIRSARRIRLRVAGHGWSDVIPTLIGRRAVVRPPVGVPVGDGEPVEVPAAVGPAA